MELLEVTHKKPDGTMVDPRAARIKDRIEERVIELTQAPRPESSTSEPAELTQAQLDDLYLQVNNISFQ